MVEPRSYLFIPADSEKKLAKADGAGADAIILDLEDSVAPANKPRARELAAEFLERRPESKRDFEIWIRINPLNTEEASADIESLSASPDGIVLPKPDGPEDARTLSTILDGFEAGCGAENGSIKIVAIATETAVAPFRLGEYATAGLSRLRGLTWGAEDLSAALGASTNLSADGELAFTYKLVRSLCLMGACAAGVQPIEAAFTDFRNLDRLRADCDAARAEGFAGRLAIHPAQVAVINECFTPSEAEVQFAERVVAAFDAAPGGGVVGLDGKMLDIPHLKQAKRVLSQWAAFQSKP